MEVLMLRLHAFLCTNGNCQVVTLVGNTNKDDVMACPRDRGSLKYLGMVPLALHWENGNQMSDAEIAVRLSLDSSLLSPLPGGGS
jgi:hypothetical protein